MPRLPKGCRTDDGQTARCKGGTIARFNRKAGKWRVESRRRLDRGE